MFLINILNLQVQSHLLFVNGIIIIKKNQSKLLYIITIQ